MAALPQPGDLTSLVLRTDFSDDKAWKVLQAAIEDMDGQRRATYVSDRAYAGLSVQALAAANAAARDDEKLTYLFLADAVTMTDEEQPLLAVDLSVEPGRSFRVLPRWYAGVSDNLTIANMGFAEFAEVADGSGTFHGFEGE